MLRATSLIAALFGMLVLPALVMAQPAPGGGGAGGGGFGGGGPGGGPGGGGFGRGFDPAMMLDFIKQQLGASDDEWKALQPKVQKVIDTQQVANSGRGGRGRGGPGGGPGGGGPGGQGGPGGGFNLPDNPVSRAMNELRTALQDTNTSSDTITAKLTALRSAREKARADLAAAQKDLKDLLTARQEAVLVTLGYLE
ncbi:MAG TPA: hypothetical protein VHD56_13460 [Tepidisphaeraceae bacterium]|nr:hypothetical protein [Tepidisphaeraceae bacterium]